MTTVTIGGTSYKVKTAWSEVDPDELLKCKEQTVPELSYLTEIPASILEALADPLPLLTLTSFLDNPADVVLEAIEFDVPNVDKQAYQKFEKCKMLMRSGKLYTKLFNIARVYYPDEKNSVHLISIGLNILNQIEVFLSGYKEMYEEGLTPEQELAGFARLSSFGPWGTAYTLAGQDPTKTNDILNLPAIEVYTALFFNFLQSKAQKAFIEITRPKT